ncbi:hypothetical protein H5410_022149 [Solanum commersonii]|uniref:Uncharacterized protein n=1 Tax=Solanum commersonii TaxID=4109 RepID=A0A9J5ZH82_SOLCO|nr:hypothetical protein H5410_022149 [Solanum commersonii]
MSASGKQCRLTAGGISQGMHASTPRDGKRRQRQRSIKARDDKRGICASGKQRRPMARDIIQRLHTSNVACTHRPTDVGQQQAASAKACTHQT